MEHRSSLWQRFKEWLIGIPTADQAERITSEELVKYYFLEDHVSDEILHAFRKYCHLHEQLIERTLSERDPGRPLTEDVVVAASGEPLLRDFLLACVVHAACSAGQEALMLWPDLATVQQARDRLDRLLAALKLSKFVQSAILEFASFRTWQEEHTPTPHIFLATWEQLSAVLSEMPHFAGQNALSHSQAQVRWPLAAWQIVAVYEATGFEQNQDFISFVQQHRQRLAAEGLPLELLWSYTGSSPSDAMRFVQRTCGKAGAQIPVTFLSLDRP